VNQGDVQRRHSRQQPASQAGAGVGNLSDHLLQHGRPHELGALLQGVPQSAHGGLEIREPQYRGRSKYFRPKTRIAVMKSMANVAQSLFGTGDVVAVTASKSRREPAGRRRAETRNPRTIGSSASLAAMASDGSSPPMAPTKRRRSPASAFRSKLGSTAKIPWSPARSPMARAPCWRIAQGITLIAPENCLFDANCDWTNPSQSSQYVHIRYPMSVDECMTLIDQNVGAGNNVFIPIDRGVVQSHARATAPIDTTATRSAREAAAKPRNAGVGLVFRVWVNEVFMRVGDLDVVYWTLDNKIMLSHPMPVRKAYPAFAGERPVVIGYGALEAFRPIPMSPVESWQQMQMETNDQTNLRLDHMKQVVARRRRSRAGKRSI